MSFFSPPEATPAQRHNYRNVQIDAIGIGLASAAAPFLPVFLTRLGATNFQVGLLAALPAMTGFCLAVAVGSFLQSRRNIVPWFGLGRLLTISAYTLTGLAPFFVPQSYLVPVIIAIWALATIPQTMVNVAFSVVMSAVAGPSGRYELMSRRWSILGLTTAITVALVGKVLDYVAFPFNYQWVFVALSIGGLVSFYYSSHLDLPDALPPEATGKQPLKTRFRNYAGLIRSEPAFMAFTARQFIYTAGISLALPLFPLYYVREVQANDTWIGLINTAQTAIVLAGYYYWTRQSRRRGGRFVLLCTTLGLALHPIMVAMTNQVGLIVLFAGLGGIFQAGLNLVFFDEQMKTIPARYSATFVSFSQSLNYFAAALAPLVGTLLATEIGLGNALLISAVVRLVGFGLFAWPGLPKPRRPRRAFLNRLTLRRSI